MFKLNELGEIILTEYIGIYVDTESKSVVLQK